MADPSAILTPANAVAPASDSATGFTPSPQPVKASGIPGRAAQPGTLAYLRETCEDCIAILKAGNDAVDAEIAATPISGDIVRFRALLAQRGHMTELEVDQLAYLGREALSRVQRDHYRRVEDATVLFGILTDIGVDPQVENGRVEVTCLSAAEMMNIGALLTEQYPREAASIIESSRYDAVRFVVWWDVSRFAGYREVA